MYAGSLLSFLLLSSISILVDARHLTGSKRGAVCFIVGNTALPAEVQAGIPKLATEVTCLKKQVRKVFPILELVLSLLSVKSNHFV